MSESPGERLEFLISPSGAVSLNGTRISVGEKEVHVAVLDAVHSAAQERGEPVDATVLDLRGGGYATYIRVAPDGSSQLVEPDAAPPRSSTGEDGTTPPGEGTGPTALTAEAEPPASAERAEPQAPTTKPAPAASAGEAEPAASVGEFVPAPAAGEAVPVASSAEAEPAASVGGFVPAPSAGGAAPFPSSAEAEPVASAGESAPAASAGGSEPAASAEEVASPASAGGTGADAGTGPGMPAPEEGAGPAVPAELRDAVVHINRAAAGGEPQRAMVLAFRLREHAVRRYGEEHPYTVEARDLEAYVARLAGDHANSIAIYCHLARLCHRLGDPRAYGYLERAIGNWRRLTEPQELRTHGKELVETWAVLAPESGPPGTGATVPGHLPQGLDALVGAAGTAGFEGGVA